MNRCIVYLVIVLTTILKHGGIVTAEEKPPAGNKSVPSAVADFALTSSDVVDGKLDKKHFLSEPYGFGCSGDNISPQLSWKGAPADTKNFVLMVQDLDAPTGIGWVHWVVLNIPASVSELPQGVAADGKRLPTGALQTRTDFGVPGYGGPCPPPPTEQPHRYVFTLFAIHDDTELKNLNANATPALVAFWARKRSVGTAKLTVTLSSSNDASIGK